ncbi:MAG: sigma-70 family RNA polymerase sigma factor [Myxococcales bacterium]|nr:sigma-70 family RNA polymerase sigma factor [Myxococcales bacterium]
MRFGAWKGAPAATKPDEPVESALNLPRTLVAPAPEPSASPVEQADPSSRFERVYEEHFAFVWRTLRRLGVAASAVDDAVQDVFVVVHRKLPGFEGRSSLRTWLFGIARLVARDARRATRRRRAAGLEPGEGDGALVDAAPDAGALSPQERAERAEAVAGLYTVLAALDADKRELVVLADLEEMTVPEIAEALQSNPNTVYSRLRSARHDFEQAVARLRARAAHAAPGRKPWTS